MAKRTMTPQWAEKLLANNPHNRPISQETVRKYASDMRAKPCRWRYNGDPIRVSVGGQLLDGQHRLRACIIAGVSFETEVIEGLPDDIRPTIDTGRKRSAADVLNLLGMGGTSATALAASARLVLNYLTGVNLKAALSTPAMIDLLEAEPALATASAAAAPANKIIPPGPLGAVLFLATRNPTMSKRAAQFVAPLAAGEGLEKGDPRLVLRNAIMSRRQQTGRAGIAPMLSFVLITHAWNAFAVGETLTLLRSGTDGKGFLKIPDVKGAPKFGAGVDALRKPPAPPRQAANGARASAAPI